MNVTAYFASSGVPATGLAATIKIRDVSTGTVVVNGVAMTEIGDGFYKYDFAGYVDSKDYTFLCDGGGTIAASERYAAGATSVETDIALIKENMWMGGPGGIVWTYTLTNSITGLPIPDARVWITSDLAGNNIIASGMTDNSGVVSFNLEAGPINIWREKAGFNFVNPTQEVVA